MSNKRHQAGQGIVASANLNTIYQREIFFPVDPMSLDWMDSAEVHELHISGLYLELSKEDVIKFLPYVPELEAEIFWLIYNCRKYQKDVARLLNLSQPTVSYRYRRTLAKLAYLIVLVSVDVKGLIDDLPFLKMYEKDILLDLFFYANQEMVGKKHGVRQSSAKWVFVKTKKKLELLEREDPDKWFNHMGLVLLLDRHLNLRILH